MRGMLLVSMLIGWSAVAHAALTDADAKKACEEFSIVKADQMRTVESGNPDQAGYEWNGRNGTPLTCLVDRASGTVVGVKVASGGVVSAERLRAMNKENDQLSQAKKTGDYSQQVASTKALITRDLKDPASAQFRELTMVDAGMMVLCGEINAKNSYGAYVGFKRFYSASMGDLKAIEGGKDDFVFQQMWPTMCGKPGVKVR